MKWLGRLKEDYFSIYHAINEAEIQRLLRGQLRIAGVLVAIIAAIEAAMFFVARSGGFLRTDSASYFVHYLLAPTGANLAALLVALGVRRFSKNLQLQVCVNCLMYVVFCFVAYTVHMQFASIALVFAIPILLTIVYGDFVLTTAIALVSALTKVCSDLFIIWDPTWGFRLKEPLEVADFAISLVVLAIVYGISLQAIGTERVKHKNAMNQELERLRLYQESVTDPVTGIGNRSGLRKRYAQLTEEAPGGNYTFLMIDVDNFKEINDRHGHLTGDRYLKQLAMVLDAVPNADAFRYGGDEFCMLLHGYDEAAVQVCCEEIQQKFRSCTLSREISPVTASFGASIYQPDITLSDLLWQADAALYQAKRRRGSMQFYRGER